MKNQKQILKIVWITIFVILLLFLFFNLLNVKTKDKKTLSVTQPQAECTLEKCSDCGGVWYDNNICDQEECESCSNCEYDEGSPWVPGGKCSDRVILPPVDYCFDSDGINRYIAGYVDYIENGMSDRVNDYCMAIGQVAEYSCEGTQLNLQTLECSKGCSNGRCNQDTTNPCGNGNCESSKGETEITCPEDCLKDNDGDNGDNGDGERNGDKSGFDISTILLIAGIGIIVYFFYLRRKK